MNLHAIIIIDLDLIYVLYNIDILLLTQSYRPVKIHKTVSSNMSLHLL